MAGIERGLSTNRTISLLERYFPFLFSSSVTSIEIEEDLSFGNWMVFLESIDLNIKFVHDRGEIVTFFCPSWVKDWRNNERHHYSGETLIAFFSRNISFVHFSTVPFDDIEGQLSKISFDIKPYFENIIEIFERRNYQQERDNLRAVIAKRRELFLGLSGKK
jgi:hypothetical protein